MWVGSQKEQCLFVQPAPRSKVRFWWTRVGVGHGREEIHEHPEKSFSLVLKKSDFLVSDFGSGKGEGHGACGRGHDKALAPRIVCRARSRWGQRYVLGSRCWKRSRAATTSPTSIGTSNRSVIDALNLNLKNQQIPNIEFHTSCNSEM